MRLPRRKGPAGPVHAVRRTGQPGPRFNYELFNCNNFNIRYWSWNYRGCWPFTAPPPAGTRGGRVSRAHGATPRAPPNLYTMGAPVEGILSDGTARPLSHHPEVAAGAFPRVTTAPAGFRPAGARHGITIGRTGPPRGRQPLGFPVPGHLAGTHPSPHRVLD